MSKLAMVVALLGLAACGPKAEQAPLADSAATAAAPATDSAAAAPADSMARDTTKTQ
ncbi:MAG TPA: hypothetical protein VJU15_09615 [Gemmatimonadales bacterium]|nr:hypothetical protein [Gemmatimonadales bacterium]